MTVPGSRLSIRRALVVAALTLIAALAGDAVASADLGSGGKPAKCPQQNLKGKRVACGGSARAAHYRTVRRRFRLIVPHSGRREGLSEVKTVFCPSHKRVLGGGAEVGGAELSVALSVPNEAIDGWSAQLVNLSTSADVVASLKVYAICVDDRG
jgi:hypothetical protein